MSFRKLYSLVQLGLGPELSYEMYAVWATEQKSGKTGSQGQAVRYWGHWSKSFASFIKMDQDGGSFYHSLLATTK